MHRLIHREPGFVCAVWRQVIINVWSGEITPSSLAAGRQAGVELEQEYGPESGGEPYIGVLTVVNPSMPMPSDEARAQAAQDMKASGGRTRALATIIPGGGFRASALRAAYATMSLFSRTAPPTKITAELEEGAQFLAAELELGGLHAHELAKVVEELNAEDAAN